MAEIRLYTTEEVAEILGFHINTIRRHIREGKLKAIKIGNTYRVTHEALEDYLTKGK